MHRLLVTALLLALALPAAARADDAAALYDPANVAQIDLTLSDGARAALAADPSEYVEGTFALAADGLAYGPETVDVRLKGHTSFRPLGEKAAFKVKFPKANRLLGLKSVTLNNMVQDPSMVHEALGYEILRAAGVAAPHAGFAYVRVNGDGYGLYLNLETYDDISMERLFPTTQHLYEADLPRVDLAPGGAAAFEVEEGDEDDLADLEALIAATNATGGDWSDGMAATADLAAMTRMWAGEQYVGHWDGYGVASLATSPNNYYLHSDEAGRFTMLPSGMDQTFGTVTAFPGDGGLLHEACLGDASCLQALRAGLAEVSAAADAVHAGARLDAIAATVALWRTCADLEHAGDAEWQTAVTRTRGFLRRTRNELAAYLGAPAPAPDPFLESTAKPALSTARCPALPEPPPEEEEPEPTPTPLAPAAVTPAAQAVLGAGAQRLHALRLTARVRPRRGRRATVSGRLVLPAGIGRAGLCEGRVVVRVLSGRRPLARRIARLDPDCSYMVGFRRLPRGTLTIKARFIGNGGVLPRSAAPRTTRPRA